MILDNYALPDMESRVVIMKNVEPEMRSNDEEGIALFCKFYRMDMEMIMMMMAQPHSPLSLLAVAVQKKGCSMQFTKRKNVLDQNVNG